MSAKPYDFLASNDTALTFENGMLTTQGTTKGDATLVPKAVSKALEKAATAAVGAAFNAAEAKQEPKRPAPYLFKIVVSSGTWKLVGARGAVDVNVAVAKARL